MERRGTAYGTAKKAVVKKVKKRRKEVPSSEKGRRTKKRDGRKNEQTSRGSQAVLRRETPNTIRCKGG